MKNAKQNLTLTGSESISISKVTKAKEPKDSSKEKTYAPNDGLSFRRALLHGDPFQWTARTCWSGGERSILLSRWRLDGKSSVNSSPASSTLDRSPYRVQVQRGKTGSHLSVSCYQIPSQGLLESEESCKADALNSGFAHNSLFFFLSSLCLSPAHPMGTHWLLEF